MEFRAIEFYYNFILKLGYKEISLRKNKRRTNSPSYPWLFKKISSTLASPAQTFSNPFVISYISTRTHTLTKDFVRLNPTETCRRPSHELSWLPFQATIHLSLLLLFCFLPSTQWPQTGNLGTIPAFPRPQQLISVSLWIHPHNQLSKLSASHPSQDTPAPASHFRGDGSPFHDCFTP